MFIFKDGKFDFYVASVDPPMGHIHDVVYRVREDTTPLKRIFEKLPPHSRVLGEPRLAEWHEIVQWLLEHPDLLPKCEHLQGKQCWASGTSPDDTSEPCPYHADLRLQECCFKYAWSLRRMRLLEHVRLLIGRLEALYNA